MWSYYGSKTNVIDNYPPPKFDTVIEPFCGTAKYALKYFDRDVIIVDKYDVMIKIWKWLQECSEKDILSLPILEQGENIDNFSFDCEEAKMLVGFLVNRGLNYPRKTATSWTSKDWFRSRFKYISNQLHKIRHWDIRHGSYDIIENQEATWFIDPPYQFGGDLYVENNKSISYSDLKIWCISRNGQAIVCENSKADWMDFKPIISQKIRVGKQTEVIWSNIPTAFDNIQLKLL